MQGMVVAPQPRAADVGAAVLADGGNAFDAVIAAAFAQMIADPFMCGVGGMGTMQLYVAATGEHVMLDFHTRAGSRVTPEVMAFQSSPMRSLPPVFGFLCLSGTVPSSGLVPGGEEGNRGSVIGTKGTARTGMRHAAAVPWSVDTIPGAGRLLTPRRLSPFSRTLLIPKRDRSRIHR